MEGRSHLLVGLTAGVVLDSYMHLSGAPLTTVKSIPLSLIVSKIAYYSAVGFGALLPDIDNARSTMGRKFGIISKEIQRMAGHRTILHSLLGTVLVGLLAFGLERIVIYFLGQNGYTVPADLISTSHLVLVGMLFGYVIHIACDALTLGGVPLFWPDRTRYGFPPNSRMRFRTGDWPEHVIVWTFMILVGIGIWRSIITI
jgi:inner membrane protein